MAEQPFIPPIPEQGQAAQPVPTVIIRQMPQGITVNVIGTNDKVQIVGLLECAKDAVLAPPAPEPKPKPNGKPPKIILPGTVNVPPPSQLRRR